MPREEREKEKRKEEKRGEERNGRSRWTDTATERLLGEKDTI